MVMFLMSSSCGSASEDGEDPALGSVGFEVAASCRYCGGNFACVVPVSDSVGVCRPEAVAEVVFEGVREGTRDGTVRLSRVKRSEVIITCGTW